MLSVVNDERGRRGRPSMLDEICREGAQKMLARRRAEVDGVRRRSCRRTRMTMVTAW